MLVVVNPATGEPILEMPSDDRKSIEIKLRLAENAQKKWGEVELSSRIKIITEWSALLDANLEELAYVLTREMGKPISQSLSEIKAISERVDFFTKNVGFFLKPSRMSKTHEPTQEEISYEPLGVIANISAWNYPYFVGANIFVPALLMGNAVLYKPSEFAVMTGCHIVKLMHEAGVPEDVFALVSGAGDVGSELVKQRVDGIFFTGSYSTGLKIWEQTRDRIIPVQLELGGKDPAYVCDDADIEAAAESLAEGAFYNAGQSCCSVERIYVHESVCSLFLEKLIEKTRHFIVGDPSDKKTFIGPLTRKAQLDVLDAQVADARACGGQILLGGERIPGAGYFFAPTIIADANHDMICMREESFGPIVGVQKVVSDEEALTLMNDTAYGLTAGVYCQSSQRARRLLSRLNTGSVYWNCCDRVSSRLPWTGRKNSGIGSTSSIEGLRVFGKVKSWHLKGMSN
jgi:acyl-CoA reductase-like NAD-dependent aldehyde dehydrogenase